MQDKQTADEVAAEIEAAADVIRINGLHKNDFWPGALDDGDGYQPGMPACAYGAIAVAQGITAVGKVSNCTASRTLEREHGWRTVTWNDAKETTADDVVERLLTVSKRLRNGEIEPEYGEDGPCEPIPGIG